MVVAARQATHFRILRALRPIFLIDNHYLGGVRRLTRQILQSLPPVFDMLVILFFFMTLFAILGEYHMYVHSLSLFQYFRTFYNSIVNLFVLLTTSNFPDVMIPYYANSRWASLFFVVFLLVHLYFLMNLVLAVVYERFSSLEKDKFRKLLLHRRKACHQAFRLLVNRTSPSCLYFSHFEGLMKYYKPRAKHRDVYLMFKSMDTAKNGFLSQEEFLQVYEASKLTWEAKQLGTFAINGVSLKWLQHITLPLPLFSDLVIAASFLWHIVEITQLTHGPSSFLGDGKTGFSAWVLVGLLIFYLTEMLFKIAAFGMADYFHNGWNKLFQLKKSYHDVLGTVFILMPRFVSVGLVLVIVYYFFAIIGIEVFSQYVMEDCCK
ncbi:hypothetical protein HPB48_010938 [Haemaphysalis longicornis]|uniref:EF-hand domain-containing protein n=1 Tax=Haemaphysalis longicornis TaxID=44386 RepID=A0A9J6GED1_HAELO|nr:hypothetical protein HPB48_010938 [Haemaphysalis longicornis]